MHRINILIKTLLSCAFLFAMVVILMPQAARGTSIDKIRERNVIRHLGVPYANFVTGSGDGLDVELIKLFARHLGVRYYYVETSWANVIGDLTGKVVVPQGNDIVMLKAVPVRGDVVANGFTVLPWREKCVLFSRPTFPTQIWLLARANVMAQPIRPSHDVDRDIMEVKKLLAGKSLLGAAGTCLDPSLYHLEGTKAEIRLFTGSLNELAPAVIQHDADMTLLDVPDALIALEKWPGMIKVMGPLSRRQHMACAFSKDSSELRNAFDDFLESLIKKGTYQKLVKHYYPSLIHYYPDFFQETR